MKAIKSILILLIAFLLTGCYTQLQYTKTNGTPSERNQTKSSAEQAGAYHSEKYEDAYYTPSGYFKNYDYLGYWQECMCSPYRTYNIFGDNYISSWSYYYRYRTYHSLYDYEPAFGPYYSWFQATYMNPLYRWNYNIRWGTGFYSRYHSPFYYGYYWQSNYHLFYIAGLNNNLYGSSAGNNSRYGPRSIASSLTRSQAVMHRNRGTNNPGRRAVAKVGYERSRTYVDSSGSLGTVSRSGSTPTNHKRNRETVNRSNSGNNSPSRANVSRSGPDNKRSRTANNAITTYLNRSDDILGQMSGSTSDLEKYIIPNSRIQKMESSRKNNFFGRVKDFMKNGSVGKSTRYVDRTGKGFGKSRSIGTSVKNKNRSTVSKSNKSRKRSKASSSRSSSSSSSGEKRSRGGN